MNRNKAYIIKGSVIDSGERIEWIEGITTSKNRAEKIKKKLNISLLESIEKGREVFDLYLKENEDNLGWEKMEFHTEKMNEKEFDYFCSYRYGTKLPFKIEQIDMV